jgi:beta-lactamase superfamily II metal-dependent hydrolase
MYNVGFGDCFLLFVPTEEGERKILIDCGSIKLADNSMKAIIDRLLADIRGPDGKPHVDLLVATHRHKDHIIGFADPRWHDVSVGEVWMPWMENPRDPVARQLRLRQDRLVAALEHSIKLREDELYRAPALLDLVANAASNGDALDMLHRGFRGNPQRRYLPLRNRLPGVVRPDVLPGVTVHVLGPPFDEEILSSMNPGQGESYLAALESDVGDYETEETTFDFGWRWAIKDDIAERYIPRRLRLIRKDMKAVQDHAVARDWELLAASTDQAINNTSLILFMQIGSAGLFFPGDAQWGPWQSLLLDKDIRQLLARTSFYKVSHHASHNATPPGYVELLEQEGNNKDRWAMVSVAKHERFDDVPREPLLRKLRGVAPNLVRSDKTTGPSGVKREEKLWVEISIPTA